MGPFRAESILCVGFLYHAELAWRKLRPASIDIQPKEAAVSKLVLAVHAWNDI